MVFCIQCDLIFDLLALGEEAEESSQKKPGNRETGSKDKSIRKLRSLEERKLFGSVFDSDSDISDYMPSTTRSLSRTRRRSAPRRKKRSTSRTRLRYRKPSRTRTRKSKSAVRGRSLSRHKTKKVRSNNISKRKGHSKLVSKSKLKAARTVKKRSDPNKENTMISSNGGSKRSTAVRYFVSEFRYERFV